MQNTILLKCITELKSDKPKIEYVLGMLEAVVSMSGASLPTNINIPYVSQETKTNNPTTGATNTGITEPTEEGSGLLGAYLKDAGNVAELKY